MTKTARRPIVSSAHLVSPRGAELSEFEYGLILSGQAFNRWMVRCAAAAGMGELNPLEVLVLHSVNHRDRAKRLADLCLVLNVEDTHTVAYACKKLLRAGLIKSQKRGKEVFHSTTKAGGRACAAYAQVREACLMESLATLGLKKAEIGHLATSLRALSGLYDQAARAAASL